MLEKVKIKNFQSHRSTEIELSSAVNTIQGNSDCGKSAVMRALNWLIFNPAGDYFVSDWARKGKSISAPCEVTLVVDGHTITRKRDKDFNGYILDGQVFEATRNSVPPQVADVLGLGEVNIQRQLDPPFLLSKSSGDVSRYINSLVNLTRIDEWTAAANSRGRLLNQKVDAASVQLNTAQKEVDNYSFLPELEELSKKLTASADSIEGLDVSIGQLRRNLDIYLIQKANFDEIPDVDKLFELLKEAEKKSKEFDLRRVEAEGVSNKVRSFLILKKDLDAVPDLETAEAELSRASAAKEKIVSLTQELKEVSSSLERRNGISLVDVPDELFETIEKIERYRNVRRNLEESVEKILDSTKKHKINSFDFRESQKELVAVENQLSTMVCPLCGRREFYGRCME